MSMQDAEAQRQIQQMVNFIINEARDKAQELEAKALEDFNIEKLKLVQQMKNKVRQEYQQKAKQMETQRAIARSTAVTKSRLRKVGARNSVLGEVVGAASQQLATLLHDSPDKYKALCTDLCTQAALMLLEAELYVRVRPEDEKLVASCFVPAEKAYSDIIRRDSGVEQKVKLIIDKENYLPGGSKDKTDSTRTCIGGLVVTTLNRKIVVDNTLDARLGLVMKECLPQVRKLLFPVHH